MNKRTVVSLEKEGMSFGPATRVYLDFEIGRISVEHDGSISWDMLQKIKDAFAGPEAVAIEIYPPHDRVVNCVNMRHLWLLGDGDWWPDMSCEGKPEMQTLRERFLRARLQDGGLI